MARVLIVDDEAAFSSGIAEFLALKGHSAVAADSLAAARSAIAGRVPDVLLLDLMLPDGSGLELLDSFEDRKPQKIIIVTGHAGVKSLIGGMAGDGVLYMKKPVEPRELVGILNTIDAAENGEAGAGVKLHYGLLVGESPAMQSVYAQIKQVAVTDSTVFIQGESGTGKELVADAIHRESNRRGEFVPVNCGGLSKELISAQLFGHENGSFTGASR
jgi:DNA-binding NtrC family response regulator